MRMRLTMSAQDEGPPAKLDRAEVTQAEHRICKFVATACHTLQAINR
jgi:hypothetical protein